MAYDTTKTLAQANAANTAHEYDEKVVQISRVSKKTKGGNKMGFSILMVVGDKKGRVGVGLGKAGDVQAAMRKGIKKAKKKMIVVPMNGTTIPFSIEMKKGAGRVLLKPAPQGSGVIAGGPVRAVVEAAGIRDISSKILGTNNKSSNVYATFEALKAIEKIVQLKGLKLKSIAQTEAEEAKKIEELQRQAATHGAKEIEKAKAKPAQPAKPAAKLVLKPKAVEPKAVEPKTAEPKAEEAKVEPKAEETKVTTDEVKPAEKKAKAKKPTTAKKSA